jgi:hypothetical protein
MRSGTLDVLQILLATAEKAAEQGTRPRQGSPGRRPGTVAGRLLLLGTGTLARDDCVDLIVHQIMNSYRLQNS